MAKKVYQSSADVVSYEEVNLGLPWDLGAERLIVLRDNEKEFSKGAVVLPDEPQRRPKH
jgi:hypothetical protein